MNLMQYKGYLGTVDYSPESHCLYGKLAFIRDLVTYEAQDVDGIRAEFHAAVDDYLQACASQGVAPNTPCKGSFNVRTGAALHRAAVMAADGQNLNSFVCDAIRAKVAAAGIELDAVS